MYRDAYHRLVAEVDFGIYNWKRHSTGYLLKMLRDTYYYDWGCNHNDWLDHNDWVNEWQTRLKDELAKRPHISNKKERKSK
jgi:hypothetical protein